MDQKAREASLNMADNLEKNKRSKDSMEFLEKQFRRYVEDALEFKGTPVRHFLSILKTFLDNVVFRLVLLPAVPQQDRWFSHGHVLVNGKRLNIPSCKLVVGDTVTIRLPKISANPEVKKAIENKDIKLPGWLLRKALVGK